MNRLLANCTLIILWGGLLFFSACQSGNEAPAANQDEASSTEPPNIIFIMTDDHAYQAISAYGSELMQTPNIVRTVQPPMCDVRRVRASRFTF